MLVIGSFLFWIFSILIVTLPAAVIGLFAAVGGVVRPGSLDAVGRFWRGFKRSFLTALGLGLLTLVLSAILYLDINFFWALGTAWGKALAFISGGMAAVALMASAFAWPLLAWYPQPLRKLLRRSLLLAAAHPLHAIGGLAGALLSLWLLALVPGPVLAILPAVGPGLAATVLAASVWSVMRRYQGADDEFAD